MATNARDTLSSILSVALEMGMIDVNPAGFTYRYPEKGIRAETADGVWLTSFDEHVRLLEYLKEHHPGEGSIVDGRVEREHRTGGIGGKRGIVRGRGSGSRGGRRISRARCPIRRRRCCGVRFRSGIVTLCRKSGIDGQKRKARGEAEREQESRYASRRIAMPVQTDPLFSF